MKNGRTIMRSKRTTLGAASVVLACSILGVAAAPAAAAPAHELWTVDAKPKATVLVTGAIRVKSHTKAECWGWTKPVNPPLVGVIPGAYTACLMGLLPKKPN